MNYSNKLQEKHRYEAIAETLHTVLYVYCVDLLMESPTKFAFLLYDFFYDLLWFFKDSTKINKKEQIHTQNRLRGLFDRF